MYKHVHTNLCVHVHFTCHMHIMCDFRNREFTVIPPIAIHPPRVHSYFRIPYFYVPSPESQLRETSVFTC